MPRPAVGSARWNPLKGHWEVRVTLTDGSRSKPIPLIDREGRPTLQQHETERARQAARGISSKYRLDGLVPEMLGEVVNEWVVRWYEDRERRGLTSVRDDRSHYRLHVADLLGTKPIASVTRTDLELLVQDLDRKVMAGEMAWKSAQNVWATASKMFADAANAKSLELRVPGLANPAKDVRAPDRGLTKAKQFLFPSEFLAFVTCPLVPLKWRRAVTLAIYLYCRDGELRVLHWATDVNLERGTVHVNKAWDRRTREVKSTKSKKTRRFSAERTLLPLLHAMRDEVNGEGAVIALPSERDMSRGLKRWLRKAGVTREELHTDTATTKGITWHDLRATAGTWLAIRGDDPLKIMQRLGHTDFATSQLYIREAESVREGFGEVFPPLPDSLLSPDPASEGFGNIGRSFVENPNDSARSWRGGRDSKPARSSRYDASRRFAHARSGLGGSTVREQHT